MGNAVHNHRGGQGKRARHNGEVSCHDEQESEGEDENEVDVAGTSIFMRCFAEDNVLVFLSSSSGKCLRVVYGDVDGKGGHASEAQFVVHVRGKHVVALQNVHDHSSWLKIEHGRLSGEGTGDKLCEFHIEEHDGCVVLESVRFPRQYVGILPDGEAKAPDQTGIEEDARFTPIMKEPTVVGDTELLWMWAFETGNEIALTSAVSGTCLEIMDGIVACHGEKKRETARFVVHVRRMGVVALQNVKDPGAWLRIRHDMLDGNGRGGRYCEFRVEEIESFVVLESVHCPGQFIGVFPDGDIEPPKKTGKANDNTRFIPTIIGKEDGATNED